MRNWLVYIRKEKNISQGELAKLVGVTQPSMCAIEKGRKTPRPATAQKIADILGFPWTRFYE